ncbi:MAG: tetratricopeptide repeat protein [Candidatus Acidiferrum sp.]
MSTGHEFMLHRNNIPFTFHLLCLLLVVLPVMLGSTPIGRCQDSSFGATVSVHELKIPQKARESLEKGVQRLNAGDPRGSEPFFRKAIEKFPGYYEAYYELGLAQARLGQNNQASHSFQSAIDLSEGNFPLAEFAYGLFLCDQGNVKDAERLVRRGLDQDQNIPDGFVALGVVMLYRHQPAEAAHNAQEALSRNSRLATAYLVLAEADHQRNNYSAEIQHLTAYLNLEPKGPRSEFARDLRNTAERLASGSANQVVNNHN